MDRKFSYGKLNTQLSESNPVQEQQQVAMPKETGNSVSENIVSGVTNAISAVGGLFDMQPSNPDKNEAEYMRGQALKRKKKPEKRKGIRR